MLLTIFPTQIYEQVEARWGFYAEAQAVHDRGVAALSAAASSMNNPGPNGWWDKSVVPRSELRLVRCRGVYFLGARVRAIIRHLFHNKKLCVCVCLANLLALHGGFFMLSMCQCTGKYRGKSDLEAPEFKKASDI